MTSKNITKDALVKKEITRLNKIYSDLPEKEKAVIEGLIRRAAHMKITLEEMETDLDEKGYVELFSQSDKTEPYERERPVARLYNTLNKNYQTIMKQLSEFVGKEPPKPKEGDAFDEFVNNRDD